MKDVHPKIKVNLYENYLTDDPNCLTAKVISERTLNTKEICQTAVKRGGAPSTAEAMEHNVKLFLKEMTYQLKGGFGINTEYFTASTQVRGAFKNRNEKFDPNKHSVLFRFNQGVLLRKELSDIEVQVMGMGEVGIIISHVVDVKTGSVNDLITPGGTLKIRGGKLKIVGDNPQVGVSFEDEAGNAVQVDERDIIVNKPSELLVHIPELNAGRYQLTICNQYSVGALLKEPRTTVYEKILTVG
jgi:hypothetical protein